jgi:hypothetical protein
MFPVTTRVAPRSRAAAVGSFALRLRTTLEGTTQSDCWPASRLESLLVSESIKPRATSASPGSVPLVSKGNTAMWFWTLLAKRRASSMRTLSESRAPLPTTRTIRIAAVAIHPALDFAALEEDPCQRGLDAYSAACFHSPAGAARPRPLSCLAAAPVVEITARAACNSA